MKKLRIILGLTLAAILLAGPPVIAPVIAADLTAKYTEEAVGSGHPTKADTINRLTLVEHNTDGTHKTAAAATLGLGDWIQTTGTFTATPASTSTITMTTDLTATLLVGKPVKYAIGGTTYYGIVSAITSNLLTVAGAPLGGDVTALHYGNGARVVQINVMIPDSYEDADNAALIASDLNSQLVWNKVKAYCVRYRVYSKVHDSHATHGKATVYVNSADVNSSAGGLTIAADATWYSTVVDINTSNYDVNPGEVIEIGATKGGTGDASNLTVEMTFVIP